MSGTKKLEAGQFLFREGDPSDAMYVVKNGRFAVTKQKANSEIILAEIGPGAMVGEMAFFDNKPRSANVKAIKDSEVITLPFKALYAQFASFPEWAKAIMRTVNDHLRTANARIKSLDTANPESAEVFPPHTITKLMSILTLVAKSFGTEDPTGTLVPSGILRNFTIQVFQEPTNKMQKLLAVLQEAGFAKTEDLGEGQQKITLSQLPLLLDFVQFYNHFLFQREEDRKPVSADELKVMKLVLAYSKDLPKDEKHLAKLNVTEFLAKLTADGKALRPDEIDALIARGLLGEKVMTGEVITCQVQMDDLEKFTPYWDLILRLRNVAKT